MAFGFLILKPGPVEVVVVVHHRSLKIIRAELIHENGFPKKLDGVILVPFFIKHHPILEPAAAALLDENPQGFIRVFRFIGPDHTHLFRRVLGHRDDRFCQSLFTHLELTGEATPAFWQRQLGQSHFLQNS